MEYPVKTPEDDMLESETFDWGDDFFPLADDPLAAATTFWTYGSNDPPDEAGEGSRKRSFSTHVDGDVAHLGKESKSAKTTPPPIIDLDVFSPSPVKPPRSPDVIDLTGVDDEAELDRVPETSSRQQHDHKGSAPTKGTPSLKLAARPAPSYSWSSSHARPANAGQVPRAPPRPYYDGLDAASSSLNRQLLNVQQPTQPKLIRTQPANLSVSSSMGHNPSSIQIPGSFPSSDDSEDEFRQMNNLPPRIKPQSTAPNLAFSGLAPVSGYGAQAPAPAPWNLPPPRQSASAAFAAQPNMFTANLPSLPSLSLPTSLPSLPSLTSFPSMGGFTGVMNQVNNALQQCSQTLTGAIPDNLFVDDVNTSEERWGYIDHDKRLMDLLKNIRPDSDLPAEKCAETPDALSVRLMPHQRKALRWMKDQEDGVNNGGILADEMGLGKTVTMLSLIVARPAAQNEIKTNLIIGPVSLIKQWEDEIIHKIKPDHALRVLLFHNNKKGMTFEQMRQFDVVLTTYGTITSEAKRDKKYRKQHENTLNFDPNNDQVLKKLCPLLHSKSKFYRIILDEAHNIKNPKTQTADAAHRLKAAYRWCLTGTPMMNGAHELFSLLCFVRVEPYTSQAVFNQHFGALNPNTFRSTRARASRPAWTHNESMKQFQVVLKAVMLRRTKQSEIDGKPILELPPKSEEETRVGFSKAERNFYTALETRSRDQFNVYVRAGTVNKNYSAILVLLLRLRQACCHPHLNMDLEFVEVDEEKIEMAKQLPPHVVDNIKASLSGVCLTCQEPVADPLLIIPCGHSICTECLSDLIARSPIDALGLGGTQLECPTCNVGFTSTNVINCATFKSVHMKEAAAADEDALGRDPTADGDNGSAPSSPAQPEASPVDDASSENTAEDEIVWTEEDSDSDGEYTDVDEEGNLADFVVPDDASDEEAVFDNDDDEIDIRRPKPRKSGGRGDSNKVRDAEADADDEDDDYRPPHVASKRTKGGQAKAKSKPKEKKKKREKVTASELAALHKRASRSKSDRAAYMGYLTKNWISSAKVDTCCKLLYDIQKTGEKTLVFSVWTVLLDLLEVAIRKELRMKVVRYDGGMSMTQRADAVRRLRDDPDLTIMLLSLRAGNAGLNLTTASHVIIMDPFWNPYVEMQAVDRAHRIGQERPVRVHRILVNDTVEDRIVTMQQNKRALVEAALDEKDARALGTLSLQELRYLLAPNRSRAAH